MIIIGLMLLIADLYAVCYMLSEYNAPWWWWPTEILVFLLGMLFTMIGFKQLEEK